MNILLTGGAGYIGSHIAIALVETGHQPFILDNFSNSLPTIGTRLDRIAGSPIKIIRGDVRDADLVRSILCSEKIEAVVHLAGLKSVAQSVSHPLSYYNNNVGGTIALLEAMEKVGVRKLVFSSSATVYGEPQDLPITEEHPRRAVSPYGQSKLICENILIDLISSNVGWKVSLLRYFNPVGAHGSGAIGEDPLGLPNNIMPLLTLVASGKRQYLEVFGADYPTKDGTAVRDYIHVMDLAEGHVAALDALSGGDALQTFNLGTGRGTSVLELIAAFEHATGEAVPLSVTERRPGDVAMLYAAVGKAERLLSWRAKRGLLEMCADSWKFTSVNGAGNSLA
jgi:UDP-glucose 4-epimerase